MAIDGLFCAALAKELSVLAGYKIEKINHTGDEEIVLKLYGDGRRHELLISASRISARLCLCTQSLSMNPIPTSFCMLLRKHLMNGRITAVFAPENERIVCIDVESRDELGYLCQKRIYAELMGKYSNIVLTGDGDKVLGALYQTDITFSARTIMVGLPYEFPPKQDKLSPWGIAKEQFFALCDSRSEREGADFFLKTFACFSPLTAREAAFRGGALGKEIGCADRESFWAAFDSVLHGEHEPCRVLDSDGRAVAFSFIKLCQYGNEFTVEPCGSLSELLCRHFEEKGRQEKHDRRSADILRLLSNLHARVEKKRALQLQALEDSKEKERYKQLGDLIIANIYLLKQGMESAVLTNWESGEEVTVALDKRLTHANNAKAYYKKYTKLKHAELAMAEQLEKTERELLYIESVTDAVRRAESDGEFEDIRAELTDAGYIRGKARGKRFKQQSKPLEFRLCDGSLLRVGRNNVQNDALTFSANKTDIWFHVKNAPGSHAVLYTDGKEPSAEVYTEAAELAAYHSSLRGNKGVAVDYAPVRFVKKPSGAAPGYVIYTHYHTAFVDGSGEKNNH